MAIDRVLHNTKPIKKVKKLFEAEEKEIEAATKSVIKKLPPNARAIDRYCAVRDVVDPIRDAYHDKVRKAESSYIKRRTRIGGTIGALATAGITAGGIYAVNKYRHRKRNDNTEE